MNKVAIVLVCVAACGGKKSDDNNNNANPVGAKATDTTTCPMPTNADVRERFAVGATPDYRVNAMVGEAPKCHDEFIANDVVTLQGGQPKLVAEGTFQGHCPGEADIKRTFEAVKPAKAVISVEATHTDLGGELGAGKPAILDSKMPDKLVGISVGVADRCGTALSLGVTGNVTTWTLGAGCDSVAKLTPYQLGMATDGMNSQTMQITPIGPGTCTATAELLGVKGDISITVK
jgi:hypothetical protein